MDKIRKVVIKVGSSLILNERNMVSRGFFRSIAGQVRRLKERKTDALIVSSGAIALGMNILGLRKKPKEMTKRQALASLGQIYLMDLYRKSFEQVGLKVGQVLITHEDIKDRKRCLNLRNTLHMLLSMGVVPIVNENDTVSFEEIRFGDNDNLSVLIALISEADLVLLLSDVDGLFDTDPKGKRPAHIIKRVEKIDGEIEKLALGTRSATSVGGMRSKLEAAKKGAYFGIPTRVVRGSEPDVVVRVLEGEDIGTLFLPEKRLPRKKWWVAFAMKAKGRVRIDEGAKEAILRRGKSLLPSGVRATEGEFLRGDCVEIEDEEGKTIGRGVTNYSSREIELIKGLKSIDIEGKLGYKYSDEIIHRDNMVIL